MKLNNRILLILILIISVFLNFYNLGERSFVPHEVENAKLKPLALNKVNYVASPFYVFFLHIWPNFGSLEFSLRSVSSFFGILSLFVLYFFIKYLFDFRIAILTTFLLSISPYFIFINRQVISSSMGLFFCLLQLYLFFKLLENNKLILWFLFFISTVLGLFSHEAILYLVFLENFYLFLNYKKFKRIIKSWIILNLSLVIIFISITNFLMPKRISWLLDTVLFGKDHYVLLPLGVLGKIVYLFYLFTLGETVFPWTWFVTIPTLIVFLMLFGFSLFKLSKEKEKLQFFIIFLFSPILLLNFLRNFSPRYFFPLLPLYYSFIAYGISKITRASRIIFIIMIVFVCSYSLFNYYIGREFHNNTYLDPYREVVSYIKQNSKKDDVIIFTRISDSFYYYLGQDIKTSIDTVDLLEIIQNNKNINISVELLRQTKGKYNYKRVWFVENSPGWFTPKDIDDKIIKENSDKLKECLDKVFRLLECKKYGQDKYANIKRRFINKVIVDYRMVVSLYEIK